MIFFPKFAPSLNMIFFPKFAPSPNGNKLSKFAPSPNGKWRVMTFFSMQKEGGGRR